MKVTLLLLCISMLSGCTATEFVPHSGDLAFAVSSESVMSQAIADATIWQDSIGYDHVAIVSEEADGVYVIEASSRYGVVMTPWRDFVDSATVVNQRPGIVVKRLTIPIDAEKIIARAKSHLGEEYDWTYRDENGKMYCSELVHDSYKYEDGAPMFKASPMNFKNANGEMPQFWTDLFNRLGESVPQGELGTNPNEMAKSPLLEEVYRYF